MMGGAYSEKQVYEAAARRRRTDFLITSVIFAVFIAAALVAIFFVRENFIGVAVGVVCLIWLIYSYAKSMKRIPSVSVLFSGEMSGEITAIDYTVPKSDRDTKRAIITVSSGGKSRKLKGLSAEAAGAYTVGEKVLIVAGTQYPIILERDSRIIPCPICGKVRPYTKIKCDGCGN